jgi:hypothetical protein
MATTRSAKIGMACVPLVAVLSACEATPEEPAPRAPPTDRQAAGQAPELPPRLPDRSWTSVHPTNLPALPAPDWVTAEAQLDESRGMLQASGSGDDAGNQPRRALAAARRAAAARLVEWLEERSMPAPREAAMRLVQTHIGADGRAYALVEVELQQEP